MARKTKASKSPRGDNATPSLTGDSHSVQHRLDRIAANYDLLDEMLADLEARVPGALPAEDGTSGSPGKPR